MSEIVVHRCHGLPVAQARDLVEDFARRLGTDFGGSYAWEGDTLTFRRPGASGRMIVTPERFELRVQIGLLLSPFHARIERSIDAFFDEQLGAQEGAVPRAARATADGAHLAARRRAATRSSRSQGASRSVRPK
jgi:putative polyhydroxyalkanoate system protein